MQDQGGHNIIGHENLFKNPTYGGSSSQAAVNNYTNTVREVSTVPQDDDIDWYIGW